MIFDGDSIQVSQLDNGIVELKFDNKKESVNKFDQQTMADLKDAVAAIEGTSGLKGVLVTSGKDGFIVGADITEFGETFKAPDEEFLGWMDAANAVFNSVEDLPVPTVTAINGIALGGGFEMCLATDFRVMSSKAQVGLPEVKLGIYPGFGGTVRLPRLIGADNAIEWIAQTKQYKADAALAMGAVDAVAAPEDLQAFALDLLQQAIDGELDYKAVREQKTSKLNLDPIDSMMVFEIAKGFIAGATKGQYPAPIEAVKTMQKAATMDRAGALKVEAKGFMKLARTTESQALISLFMNDQLIKKKGKVYDKQAKSVKEAAVLGAGIMGGGIAYQSAVKGTPILMKDINEPALDLGMGEAVKLLSKQVERKKIDAPKMGKVLSDIRPTLNYGDFANVDIVVEAVVENENIKKSVLADLEKQVTDGTILTSNTSSISITRLAEALEKPENFCGMHFFNPVHRMPLVEVIRGEKSSDEAIATTVAYATKMGKTPIVVNDCPGFLVNRVLFPYFAGFQILVNDGADFVKIDKLMEKFGWPMGPAYLLDVVGMDTAHHVGDVLAEGFPERMGKSTKTSLDVMYENDRLGQKNKKGFYVYEEDRKGKPKKVYDDSVEALIDEVRSERKDFSDEEIIDRMMIPMIIETAMCLEEGIVDTANEADMGLIMGIGFPPFRGGALKYADTVGLDVICEKAKSYAHLGALYEPTERMLEMAEKGEKYYG